MKKHLLCTLFAVWFVSNIQASDFYVSAAATGNGNGSFGNPWQLQQALNAPAAINNPTDTVWIWLRAGTYTNQFDAQTSFSCFTNGNADAPIIFRNYYNERVRLDGQLPYSLALALGNCSYTWFWGLEIFNSSSFDRDHSNVDRLGNVYCTAENIRFINLIVHDLGSGLDSWKTAKNTDTYGCIIYNIGNNLNNNGNWEGHGHGMYLQNDTVGVKNIENNIIFSTYGYGVKVWQTTNTAAIGNFNIQSNIVFNGGAASENEGGVGNNYRTHNFFAVPNGANNPLRNMVIKHNYTFSGTNIPRPPVNAFGLNYGVLNMTLDSNYLTGQTRLGFNNTPVFDASVKGNKIIAGIPAVYGYYLWGFTTVDYSQNTFEPIPPIAGLDYFVTPNKYEPGRAHIAIYNWDSIATVQINVLNAGLIPGDIYELVNVMDYYNDIITDTLDATGIISVPMTGHTFAPVLGSTKPPVSQFPEFGAFVIRKVGSLIVTESKDLSISNTLNVYPNPSNGIFNVNFSIDRPGDYQIIVRDILDKKTVIQNTAYFSQGNQSIQIETNGLKSGVYLLRIEGDQGYMNGKLIVHK